MENCWEDASNVRDGEGIKSGAIIIDSKLVYTLFR